LGAELGAAVFVAASTGARFEAAGSVDWSCVPAWLASEAASAEFLWHPAVQSAAARAKMASRENLEKGLISRSIQLDAI
jgi:hypothetical protein